VTSRGAEEAGPTSTSAARLVAAESAYQEQVHKDLGRNYFAHLCHGLLGQTGFRLLNAPTFLPAYLFAITGGELAIGIARSLQAFGMFLSPIYGATSIEHRKRVLPVGFLVGGSMRLMVLGIALAGFFLSDVWTVRAIWLLLLCFGFFMGMQGVIFSFLMSKVIPVERRGYLMGLRNALGGLTASGVAYLGGKYLVEPDLFGNGYSTTFLLAFVLTSLGLTMLLFVREPEPPQVRESKGVGDRLKELPALLRSDRGFTLYFMARALATMGRMAVPFYFVYADRALGGNTPENLAILTPCFLLAQSTINLPWGWMADRTGFRLVFLASIGLWVASAGLLMVSSGMLGFAVAFFGIGAAFGGFMMSAQNMVLEFGQREDLPLRIAVANSSSELIGAIGPLLGAAILLAFPHEALFATAMGFQILGALLVIFYVDEPRRRVPRLSESSPQ
jgi:MFS family permease